MNTPSNLFVGIPASLPEELVQTLHTATNIRIERIVSRGHVSPEDFWYDQKTNEWVLLLQGAARLRFENGELLEMAPGAFVYIPAHKLHRVEWTDPCEATVWLAIHHE